MSVSHRLPIIASIITLITFTFGTNQRHGVNTSPPPPTVSRLHCVLGQPIPYSPRAAALGVVGRRCSYVIIKLAG